MFKVPVLLIVVDPAINAAPFIVPPVISGLVKVLLVKVSDADCVTMTPDVGNVALELTPVPPLAPPSNPVTAED